MGYQFNPFTGNFDIALSYGALDARYLRLDTSNDPLTAGLMIDGSADEVQLTVQAHSSQTAHLQVWENSSGTDLLYVDRLGDLNFGHTDSIIRFSTGMTFRHDGSNGSFQNNIGNFFITNVANAAVQFATNNTERLTINGDGSTIFNDTGAAAADFRIEGDTDANLLFTDASTDTVGIGSGAPPYKLTIVKSNTITSSTDVGAYSQITTTPGSSSSAQNYAMWGLSIGAGSQNITGGIRGFLGTAQYTGSGTLTSAYGGFTQVSHTAAMSGTVTSNYGHASQIVNLSSSGGVMTNAYLYYGITPVATGAITNAYGLYLENINTGGTLNFAIVTNAGNIVFNEGGNVDTDVRMESDNDANLFYLDGGNESITIGSTTELAKFAIDGNADEIQFVIQGNATQTSNLQVWENSTGTDLAAVSGIGHFGVGAAPTATDVLIFTKQFTDTSGTVRGIYGLTYGNPASASTVTLKGGEFNASVFTGNAQSFSGATMYGVDCIASNAGTNTLTNAIGGRFLAIKSSTGAISTAAGVQIKIQNDNATGVISNAYNILISTPNVTGVITNLYGIFMNNISGAGTINSAITTNAGNIIFNEGGDANTDLRVEGDTDVNLLFTDASADTVQVGAATTSDSAKFYVAGKVSMSGELEVNGDLNHDGTNIGFYGVAPTPRSSAYTPTNVTTDRSYDANSTTLDEIADVLGTLIADIQLTGLLG